jgi:hypothetical protein
MFALLLIRTRSDRHNVAESGSASRDCRAVLLGQKVFFLICANLHSVVTTMEPEADPREPQLFSLAKPEFDLEEELT